MTSGQQTFGDLTKKLPMVAKWQSFGDVTERLSNDRNLVATTATFSSLFCCLSDVPATVSYFSCPGKDRLHDLERSYKLGHLARK